MALETMKNVAMINGTRVLQERIYFPQEEGKESQVNWPATDEARKHSPIFVDHDVNMISFRLQNGPIKEVGKNGCQVEDMIAVAKHIVEELNKKFPCRENSMIITKLDEAVMWSKKRTADREARRVEGLSQA